MAISNWFRKPVDSPAKPDHHNVLNPATHVSSDDLIRLQQAARPLNLERRIPAKAISAGKHFSRFRGRGMDYAESRNYQAGDDIRHMDWRVTARAGKPHSKLFQEERERPIVLLLDFSPSLFFGSRKMLKSVVAARVAALLGWAAVHHGDRVGGLLFNGDHKELPPKNSHKGVLNLIRQLIKYSDPRQGITATQHPDQFNQALKRLRRIARPGSLVFLISDFYSLDPHSEHSLQRLRQHCDLVAIQMLDPLEKTAPPAGRYGVTNGQRQGLLNTASARGRDQYKDYFTRHHQQLADTMRRHKIPLLPISTEDDIPLTLQSWFGKPAPNKTNRDTAAV